MMGDVTSFALTEGGKSCCGHNHLWMIKRPTGINKNSTFTKCTHIPPY